MNSEIEDDVSRETKAAIDEVFGEGTPPIPGQRTGDSEAPYGFTTDGKVRAKPGRKPGPRTGIRKATQKAVIPPQKKAAPRTPPAPKKTQTDYRPGLMSIASELTATASIWGLMKDDLRTVANTAAVWRATPAIVDGINTAADRWPMVASVLDRFMPLAEFGRSGGAVFLMVAQIGVNQGLMPPGLVPGTVAMETVATTFIQEMVNTNADFAAAVAAIQAGRQATQAA